MYGLKELVTYAHLIEVQQEIPADFLDKMTAQLQVWVVSEYRATAESRQRKEGEEMVEKEIV